MTGASQLDFVSSLELSHDPRLEAPQAGPTEDREKRRAVMRDRAAAEAAPDASADLRAAVNGGSLVSFAAGLDASEKSDVLYSTQFAQRAASAKHDRFAETDAWYRLYLEVMERLGWIGEGFAFAERSSSKGEFRMDKSALEVIGAIATGNQLAILVKALDSLKALAESDGAIRVFEMQAIAEKSGNYQLGPVDRAANGALSLALGAFRFRLNDRRRGFLFWTWGAEEVAFWAAAQKMTLNRDHYAPLRQTVISKLGAEAADYIVGLDVV